MSTGEGGATASPGLAERDTAPPRASVPGFAVPPPAVPPGASALLGDVVVAAARGFRDALRLDRAERAFVVGTGADGTPTMRIDEIVEGPVADAVARHGANLLSEEAGFVDRGSAVTLVVDPLDGSANAAVGMPLSAVAAVVVRDGVPVEALTCWLDTGRCWHAVAGTPTPYRTSGRRDLDGAAVDMLRPHPGRPDAAAAWWRVASRAARIRVLSTSCLEAALVADGTIDAFADAGTDTHRLVDLAAALVMLPAAGGAVVDARGRPVEIDPDLTRRWSGVVAAGPELAEALAAEIAVPPAS